MAKRQSSLILNQKSEIKTTDDSSSDQDLIIKPQANQFNQKLQLMMDGVLKSPRNEPDSYQTSHSELSKVS
jgi:hypothetical protein